MIIGTDNIPSIEIGHFKKLKSISVPTKFSKYGLIIKMTNTEIKLEIPVKKIDSNMNCRKIPFFEAPKIFFTETSFF